jgi:hypothetical protein
MFEEVALSTLAVVVFRPTRFASPPAFVVLAFLELFFYSFSNRFVLFHTLYIFYITPLVSPQICCNLFRYSLC